MAGWGHLYVTAHGDWASGPFAGETAQMGLRWAAWGPSSQSGATVTLRDHGAVSQVAENRDTAQYDIAKTFEANVLNAAGVPVPLSDDILDDIISDFASFMTSLNAYQASPFRWTHFKVAPIEKGTGKYLAPSTVYTRKSPQTPSNTSALPPDVAIAVSFRAPIVGKRGRGRMYVPALNVTALGSTGVVAANLLSSWPAAAQSLVNDLADLPGVDFTSCGLLIGSAASQTMIKPSEVRVGNIFDTQRRRDQQIKETYASRDV